MTMTGQRLAHYEVAEKIGEGGMGEVYRARDAKLGRDVALKFLPDSLSEDTERLARFEREARLLASLNHSNIASIYGFEHVGDRRFLVLEMIEGEDLSKRLVRGPIAVDEALALAREIAVALETAHEEGVVHRDLKPGNVLVSAADGSVKVLDFGLAKAWEGESAASNLSHSPTVLTNSPTVAGVILGTAAYMSPEQARGKVVDKRADIFAFGCVLYEMLSGQQAFAGETVSDTLAAVLRAEPAWDVLPAETPPSIVRMLRRCLEKDPRARLRDIGEARIVIDRAIRGEADDAPAAAASAPTDARRSRATAVAWSVAAVFALAAVASTIGFLRAPRPEPVVLRTSILPPESVRFNLRGIHPGPVAISPDGKRITYTGRLSGGASVLYVRELDAGEARALPGTDEAGYPFWSPDGRHIGFLAGGKLKQVDVTGGPALMLCDAPVGKGGAWNKDGVIVFAPSFNTPLHRVSAAGGPSTPVTQMHTETGENSHRFPQFLPGGERFLYFARGDEASSIRVGSLAGGFDKEIMRATSNAVYASGYLLFLRESALMAQRFDVDALALVGDPAPVADPVRFIPGAMCGIFAASDTDMLVYQGGASIPGARVVWRDLEGNQVSALEDIAQQDNLSVSPDGRRVAVDLFDNVGGTSDIWIYDVERQIRSRFTFDPANDVNSVWSPDGQRIVYSSNKGPAQLYVKNVEGASTEVPLVATPYDAYPTDWSRDGRHIVFFTNDSTNTGDVWAVPIDGDPTPFRVVATKYNEFGGVVSPDGHWLAYVSDESGRFEVYVTSFPKPERKWQISSVGGDNQPVWDPAGRGILYTATNTFFFVETSQSESGFAVGASRTLFESNTALSYRLSPGGDQIILLEDADEGGVNPLTLVTNWVDDLERRRSR